MVVKKVLCDGNCEVCQLSKDDTDGEIICLARTGKLPAEVIVMGKGG